MDNDFHTLIEALGSTDRSVRRRSASALGKIGDARAAEPLCKARRGDEVSHTIDDENLYTEIIAQLGQSAVEPLLNVLGERGKRHLSKEDFHKRVRAAADSELPALEEYFDYQVARERAARAMGKLGDTRSIGPLCRAVEGDVWEGVRSSAARALGKIGDTRATDALLYALGYDESVRVRDSAAIALGEIGDTRAEPR